MSHDKTTILSQQLNQIIEDITGELIIPLDLFKQMKGHFTNQKRRKYLKNSLLQIIGRNFLQSFVLGISRQLDGRKDVLSLSRILNSISADKKYSNNKELVKYKNLLANLNKNVIKMRHKFIAHRDKNVRKNKLSVNLKEIQESINTLSDVSKGLYLIVNGGLITDLLPVKQFDEDVLEIFK